MDHFRLAGWHEENGVGGQVLSDEEPSAGCPSIWSDQGWTSSNQGTTDILNSAVLKIHPIWNV